MPIRVTITGAVLFTSVGAVSASICGYPGWAAFANGMAAGVWLCVIISGHARETD